MSEEKGEWREGWGFYRAVRLDWLNWGLGIDVSIGLGAKPNREWSVFITIGPMHAFASLEHEEQLWIDGKRTDLAIGRIECE